MINRNCCFIGVAILLLMQAQPDAKKTEAEAQDSVVKIMLANGQGQVSSVGTGFFVGRGDLIATASHVYLEGERQIVDGGGGQLLLGKALRSGKRFAVPFDLAAADYPHDLAILRFNP